MIEWSAIDSSAIDEVGYDEDRRELTLLMRDGSRIIYSGVPPGVVRGLLDAGSAGRYFNAYIRDNYSYR